MKIAMIVWVDGFWVELGEGNLQYKASYNHLKIIAARMI